MFKAENITQIGGYQDYCLKMEDDNDSEYKKNAKVYDRRNTDWTLFSDAW